MENSGIEWTDHTFNPWRGCVKVSQACKNCYADALSKRNPKTLGVFGTQKQGGTRVVGAESYWKIPEKWNREAESSGIRKRVFCASLADVFEDWTGPMHNVQGGTQTFGGWHDEKPPTMEDVRERLFRLIDRTPHLDWLLLTKRPENVRKMWPYRVEQAGNGHLPFSIRHNVWLGTTVENQEQADKRIPDLMDCRDLSPCLFLSCEPLLGPVQLTSQCPIPADEEGPERIGFMVGKDDGESTLSVTRAKALQGKIDWVIAGGESGPGARPSHLGWYRSLRDQCENAGVPYHFKQWGDWAPIYGTGKLRGDEEDEQEPFIWIDRDGETSRSGTGPESLMIRVGKKKAGRLLDGVEHNGFPKGSTM